MIDSISLIMDGTKLASERLSMPPPAHMRLRITRQLCESIDGIQFSAYRVGYVYEVGTTVGNYLLADGAAELIDDDAPSIALPPDKQLFHPAALAADTARTHTKATLSHFEPIAEAADRPPRRKRAVHRPKRFPHRKLDARVAALAAEIERIRQDVHDLDVAGFRT